MQDNWPEFIYGNMTISEYVAVVIEENRNIKEEIDALVLKINDIAKYPYETRELTYIHINAICRAIHALLDASKNFGM